MQLNTQCWCVHILHYHALLVSPRFLCSTVRFQVFTKLENVQRWQKAIRQSWSSIRHTQRSFSLWILNNYTSLNVKRSYCMTKMSLMASGSELKWSDKIHIIPGLCISSVIKGLRCKEIPVCFPHIQFDNNPFDIPILH